MKKFLLSLATVLCAGAFASADEVTINLGNTQSWTGQGTSSVEANATTNGFNFKLETGTNKSNKVVDACFQSNHIRVYKGFDFTISGVNGEQITKIVLTSASSKVGNMTVGETSYSWSATAANATLEWTGDATSVKFNATGAQCQIKTVAITYTPKASPVESPKISPEGGKYNEVQTVTITGAEGTTVYYTLDGTEPTDGSIKYEAPFTVDKTTTVKAIAYDADDNTSNVVTMTYEIVLPLEGATGDGTETNPYNAAAAINACNAGSAATGVYVKGIISKIDEINVQYGNATYYISDNGTETNQFNIFRGKSFDNANFTSEDALKVGDNVVVKGDLELYNGVTPELKNSQLISLNGTTGVEGIEIDENAPVEYYNLQGVRVENPANGLYIMRQGDKVVKVIK